MFGPVMIWNQLSPRRIMQSLGMKFTPSWTAGGRPGDVGKEEWQLPVMFMEV